MTKTKAFNILLVLLSMLTIFLLSSETADKSTKTSKDVTKSVVSVVVKDEEKTDEIVDRSWLTMRKVAHFIEYFVLGFLLINLLKDYLKIDYRLILIGIFAVFLYSISDEVHQIFISGRSGEIRDVCIDTVGASTGIMFYYLLNRYYKKRKSNG